MEREERYSQEKGTRQKTVPKQKLRRQQKKNKLKGLDKYVIFCFVSLIIYTISQTVVIIKTEAESSTLTTCFFSVFGGEVLLCALIKRFKLKSESKESGEIN
ncbi:MAG: hypothetical protein K2N73_08500 [Lachnospiraceae bacterium]|nr:hypothetical protein [Lachnospiraceae bacterium]